jgi:hypothetical protein
MNSHQSICIFHMAAWNPGSLARRGVFAINGTEKDALNQLPIRQENERLV